MRNPPVALPYNLKTIVRFPGTNWVLLNLDTQLWSNCPVLVWELEGMGWFNPTDVGNSSKEGRGYTKTRLNSTTCLEVARPRKSIPTLRPWKRRNSHGSINSNVGTWAPACSLPIQEVQSNHLRLASLPSKSCSYCNPDKRCLKTLFWGQTNYFYQPPSETTPKWERPFMGAWTKNSQISSSADGKSRPDYIALWGS